MKIKFILSLRLIFYSALLLFCVLTFITYFQNKKILQLNNSVVLCVKSDLLTHYVNDESILKTEAANYINLLKKYGFSHILFDKITLRELIQNGFVTFVSGSDIINNKRICSPPPLDIERAANNSLNLKINPDYKYIISENKNLTEKIFDSLQENDITVHKLYSDSGGPFLQNNYYLEILNIPDELPNINLFYQDNAIEYFKNSQFKIALLDPNKSDIKKYGGITDAYVLDEYSIDKINELSNVTGGADFLIFKNNLIYKYPGLINKIKYLPITHTMLQRIKILDKSLRTNVYQFIIYSPTSKLNEEFESELEILSDFFKNRKTTISDSIIRFELTPNLKISYVLCLIIIVS
ncbi:MAG TPA: hypothetical protein PLQ81_13430, partial [bacterium]|nr:hypothetical protein [bacterium]